MLGVKLIESLCGSMPPGFLGLRRRLLRRVGRLDRQQESRAGAVPCHRVEGPLRDALHERRRSILLVSLGLRIAHAQEGERLGRLTGIEVDSVSVRGQGHLRQESYREGRLRRQIGDAKTEHVHLTVDEALHVVNARGRFDRPLQCRRAEVEMTLVRRRLAHFDRRPADAHLRGRQGVGPVLAPLEDLVHFGKAFLGYEPHEGVVAEVGVGHVALIAPEVPEIRLVQRDRQRRSIAPDHGTQIPVSERESISPLGGGSSVCDAVC